MRGFSSHSARRVKEYGIFSNGAPLSVVQAPFLSPMPAPFQSHLIVDGFNIAHAWGDIERRFAEGVEAVIERLTAGLKEIHDGRQMRVTAVFDGQGEQVDIRYPDSDDTFAQVFAPRALTADVVIEQMVANSASAERVYVASQDRAVIDAVTALGATVLSASALAGWLDACRRESARQAEKRAAANKLTWENRLPL